MRHVILTCKNHPNLRWTCKSIAYTPGHGYNGMRKIFFRGAKEASKDAFGECSCAATDLILAPEDEWSQLSLEEQEQQINLD